MAKFDLVKAVLRPVGYSFFFLLAIGMRATQNSNYNPPVVVRLNIRKFSETECAKI